MFLKYAGFSCWFIRSTLRCIVKAVFCNSVILCLRSKPDHLARAANRLRQRMRPQDPTDLDFEIQPSHLPDGFLRADVKIKERRHFIFATDQQLETLSKPKSWYIDATFTLVRPPFVQLLTLNAFVKEEKEIKQLPLVFVVMSRRKTKDYIKVLRKITELLPRQAVSRIVMDFEKAMWASVKSVFEDVLVMGCAFHWTQAVWRKIQELGLASAYMGHNSTHRFLRKFIALPFLPAAEIPRVFETLKAQTTGGVINEFVDYVNSTWISSTTFHPNDWSVYGQPIRTNNDLEGWHNRLNRRASGRANIPFYMLLHLLHVEALLCTINIMLVSEKKIKRTQRRRYREMQSKIFILWQEYADGTRSAKQLLKACAFLVGPV